MSGPPRTLSHIPFFEALAHSDESSEEWREISAGLVTLRLVDAWLENEPVFAHPESPTIAAVRDAIAAIERRYSVRSLLSSIVDAMDARRSPAFETVAPRLIAYARALQFDAAWALAADVYDTLLRHARGEIDCELTVAASMNLGRCRRMEADWGRALDAYRNAGVAAALCGDRMNELRAVVGEANVARDRGNLPLAEKLLDDIIARAEQEGLRELRAIGMHERAVVAHRRGDCELAVRLGYEALKGATRVWRDFVLSDLAAFFADLGVRSAARDGYLILAATAQEQYTRWMSTINLLELAALDRSEPLFEQYRRELANAPLPASQAALYHLYVGRGHHLFGRLDAAKTELQRALSIASAHKLGQLIVMAEQDLATIEHTGGVIMSQRAEVEASELTEPIARALHEELLAVAGGDRHW